MPLVVVGLGHDARGRRPRASPAADLASDLDLLETGAGRFRATARAVGAALGEAHRLEIGDVVVAALGEDPVALVRVRWVEPWGSEPLTGRGRGDDVRTAVIRATLDAVNRRLSPEPAS